MINIPTELLRTFVAVVDLRSFTRAAQLLGVTQPAVSAQIKRLQLLLGSDILDKSAPGVSLTASGELVLTYARRMLSINDQILDLASPRVGGQTIRIGLSEDFAVEALPALLAKTRATWPDTRFSLVNGPFDAMLRSLRGGDLDLLVGVFPSGAASDARHSWSEDVVWVRGRALSVDNKGPIPLVSCGRDCAFYRIAVTALQAAGIEHDHVFSGPGIVSASAAVAAGLGVMASLRGRIAHPDVHAWLEAPLPPLPAISCGIFVSEGSGQSVVSALADELAELLQPRSFGGLSGASVQKFLPQLSSPDLMVGIG